MVNSASMFTAVTGVIFIMFASSSVRDKEKSIVHTIKKDKKLTKEELEEEITILKKRVSFSGIHSLYDKIDS